ncbi:uncharacterized protein KRP23_14197 [Phytophthora ramorum]|uniref:Uncharacterized protein n=1 Tax=Phytophthora ramorum TaxID=164328 RepID=H3H0L9_PHYRM|nr:hypothetical protein KRP23_14197 [Phytophthora ramorum]
MPPLARKRGVFQDFYAVKYALRVSKRDRRGGVKEVECQMCRVFGLDEERATVGAKGKRLTRIKIWKGPCFRSDYFLRHLKTQHEVQWEIYQSLASDEEKAAFLDAEDDASDVGKDEEHSSQFEIAGAVSVAVLEREAREGREKLLMAVSDIMANQRKSVEALQEMIASMQADYMSLRQRELEVRECELACLEAERQERQEERRALREREQAEHRGREEERKADHERFLALLQAMQAR